MKKDVSITYSWSSKVWPLEPPGTDTPWKCAIQIKFIFDIVIIMIIITITFSIIHLENNITLRLVGGENAYQGRIDIELDGIWGTVCDNNWDKNDARVVCKQLGLGPGIEAAKGASFGPGTGPIYVDNLACRGHESSIAFCPNNGVEVHNCTHENDAGVVCSAPSKTLNEYFAPKTVEPQSCRYRSISLRTIYYQIHI